VNQIIVVILSYVVMFWEVFE